MGKPKTLKIDEVEYVRADSVKDLEGEIKIVILQRGWVMVGYFKRDGSDCVLSNSSTIRTWGTTNGLGQIANEGPTSSTKLDKNYGKVEFDYLTVVALISCEVGKWENEL